MQNARNESLEGSLLYSVDYVSGRHYPLIVGVYPFPSTSGWMKPMSGNQAWASAGYMGPANNQASSPGGIRAPDSDR